MRQSLRQTVSLSSFHPLESGCDAFQAFPLTHLLLARADSEVYPDPIFLIHGEDGDADKHHVTRSMRAAKGNID
jgi:hypothetical protein